MWIARLYALIKLLGREGLMLLFALRHPGTPRTIKLATLGLIAYAISPIDLLPDFALLLGWADDAAALAIGVPFLVKRLPVDVQQDVAASVSRFLGRFGAGSSSAS
ncbi:MAG: DUF1232 domain-containing protein [Burkholderiaceae bacterium]